MKLQYALSCALLMIGSSSFSFQLSNLRSLYYNKPELTKSTPHFRIPIQTDSTVTKNTKFHQLYSQNNDVTDEPTSTSSTSNSSIDSKQEEELPELTQEELTLISTIAKTDSSSLDQFLMTNLSNMPSHVVLTLRNAAEGKLPSYKETKLSDEQNVDLQTVGKALVQIMDESLQSGRDLLKSFLSCGEIRKLDASIGRAMKENKLDMAFFTVLNMNIRDAAMEQIDQGSTPSLTAEGEISSGDNANRYQILQHIYTRCQEEVEKAVSPGAGLLNKLLRTDQASIRANQLRYYLCPQAPKTISSPDGKSVELPGSKALVKPNELIDALQNAVRQIRTVERTGTVDRAAAAGLVESCRQVAIEARLAIGEGYGVDSEELKEFELSLQPVFRPDNAQSEYIKGV